MKLRSILLVVALGLPSMAFAQADDNNEVADAAPTKVTNPADATSGAVSTGTESDDSEPTKPWSVNARTAFSVKMLSSTESRVLIIFPKQYPWLDQVLFLF